MSLPAPNSNSDFEFVISGNSGSLLQLCEEKKPGHINMLSVEWQMVANAPALAVTSKPKSHNIDPSTTD